MPQQEGLRKEFRVSETSRIEWTNATWNPVTGCTKVSSGCLNCYAERMAVRLQAAGQQKYARGFKPTWHPEALDEPLSWRRPRTVFVCSMGDLFHGDVPAPFIRRVFQTMARAEQHTFQVLTKRAWRMRELSDRSLHMWPPNVWAGVSVENAAHLGRIEALRGVRAAVRFVSFEPLLGRVWPFPIQGLHWIIVGGETGPHARPLVGSWVREIHDECTNRGIPLFFKGWGSRPFDRADAGSRLLDGQEYNEMPGQPAVVT